MPETTTPSEPRGPIRTCVGCRRRRPQAELHRCVLVDAATPLVSRAAPGRGAWICGPDCLDPARKGRGFQRAWRRDLPHDLFDRLRIELTHTND